jgi:hypothetical protein
VDSFVGTIGCLRLRRVNWKAKNQACGDRNQLTQTKQMHVDRRRAAEQATDQVLAARRSSNGATLQQLLTLIGWQSRRASGLGSGAVIAILGLHVLVP